MPIAVIALDFDPVIRYGDNAVRLETLVMAAGILAALVGVGLSARRLRLRLDDLALLVLAIAPGAVAGGRLGYALIHFDYYASHAGAILDPAQGSLELSLAVVGGALTGSYAARLMGEESGPWLDVAALPMLLAIAIGKVANVLGGRGQGAPSDAAWATSYVGDRGWASLAPAIPSHPSQIYEAVAAAIVLLVLAGVLARRRLPLSGSIFFAALGGWAAGRAVVAVTWRDAPVLGPLVAEQLVCVAIVAACLFIAARLARRPASTARTRMVSPGGSAPWGIVGSSYEEPGQTESGGSR